MFGSEIAVKRGGKLLSLEEVIRIGGLFGSGSCCWFTEERELNEWLEDAGRRKHRLAVDFGDSSSHLNLVCFLFSPLLSFFLFSLAGESVALLYSKI